MDTDSIVLNLSGDTPTYEDDFYREDRKIKTKSEKHTNRKGNKTRFKGHHLQAYETDFVEQRSNIHKQNEERTHSVSGRPKGSGKDAIISSLFTKNPDIPDIHLTRKCPTNTKLFGDDKSINKDNKYGLHANFLKNLESVFSVNRFTQIQTMAIPSILSGSDCLIKSPTGSGKTLAYAIPVIHKLQAAAPKIKRSDGPYCVIILPTRELALQCYDVFELLCRTYVWIVPGVLIGGEKKKAEKSRLRRGINILLATPGRLLDHINTTKCLQLSHIRCLIFDEADRLLDMGFEKDISIIIENIKSSNKTEQQNILVSATLSEKVKSLAKLSLKDPRFLDPCDNASTGDTDTIQAPASLTQNVLFVPAKMRLVALLAFLKKNLVSSTAKVMVFVSSKASVSFHRKLLEAWVTKEALDWNLFCLHGDMPQKDRVSNLENFKKKGSSVLFCTNVAARGLDLQYVNCIIQYTCSGDIEDYIHRSGRTARMGSKGNAVLFLLPSESGYIDVLQKHNLALEELKLFDTLSMLTLDSSEKVQNIQDIATGIQLTLEELVQNSSSLTKLAADAHQSYIQAYATYPIKFKDIFNLKELHLGHIAKSFALREVPKKIANHFVQPQKKDNSRVCRKRKVNIQHLEHTGNILSGPKPGKKKKKHK